MKTSTIEISQNVKSINSFFKAILILIQKPQVINRKLSCSVNKQFLKINEAKEEILKKIKIDKIQGCCDENLKGLFDGEVNFEEAKLEDLQHVEDHSENVTFISLNKVLPRNSQKHQKCYSIAIIGLSPHPSASFYSSDKSSNLIIPSPYHLSLVDNNLKLQLDSTSEEHFRILNFVVLKKFHRWMESCSTEEDKDQLKVDSHSLINAEEYNELYNKLKEKYGKRIEAIWDGESTDPKKFVYEDVAIATYLIILWRQERVKKELKNLQSFVDFGCGNGLLVYILSEEGHRGYGIDVRKRKIWSKFNPQVDLREETWKPSDLFSDIDWIIGNHSDELSPWVSVVASKSSYTARYFLLPCCAFEFSGAKFGAKYKDKSLYMSYIDYLINVSNICGFKETKIDRLKIPSTKRICLIGEGRIYDEKDFTEQCQKIDDFVRESSDNKFEPRDKIEKVKNCTKVDQNVVERIVKIIFEKLLSEENLINSWNIGGSLELSETAKLISSDDLKLLKSECGGLQTLFKNRPNMFEVKDGKVKLRLPKMIEEVNINANKKRKIMSQQFPCYFHANHPQGCFLTENCFYKH